jgi:hypothetical protein
VRDSALRAGVLHPKDHPPMPDEGRETPLPQSLIARLAVAARYAISGVSPDTWFGPQQPLAPQAPPDVKGRQFDYPFGVNLSYVPRATGGISFAELRALADALPLLRTVIETRKDQVAALSYSVRARDPANAGDAAERAKAALAFLARPDRRHAFSAWLRMLLEDLLVIDAATLYPRFARDGALYSLDVIDGATITPLIGEDGRSPDPPDPAYQQILHGVPAADFSSDELLYLPRNLRAHKLYGFSPVEQIALTVNIALRREAATLDYYRAGSTPDAFATLPKEWTVDQIRQFQDYFDALMSGNSARRRMTKFMPADFRLIEARQPPLKDQYDEWLARLICYAFSVPASAFVSQVNRATSETLRLQATQEGLVPLKAWIKGALDEVIQTYLNQPDLEFVWVGDDAVDPLQQAQTLNILVGAGIKTIAEARADLGLAAEATAAPAFGKFNPYHDERGRFTTADGAVEPGAGRDEKPKGVQVAANENPKTNSDASPTTTRADSDDALPATHLSTPNQSPADRAPTASDKPAPPNGLKIVHDVPDDAVSLTAGDGTSFYAPPDADFCKVYADGQAHWLNLIAVGSAVGQFGTYDFQRRNGTFYSVYISAANYAVGVYMAGAGFTYDQTKEIGIIYASRHSSNAGAASQTTWWTKGWNDATNGVGPCSRAPHD